MNTFHLGWGSATKGNVFHLGWLPEEKAVAAEEKKRPYGGVVFKDDIDHQILFMAVKCIVEEYYF